MTNYADLNFYENEYLDGKEAVIDTASFNNFARSATQLIKQYTFDSIDEGNIPEEVSMCCCELAELIFDNTNVSSGKIASEKVGELSVSYESSETLLKSFGLETKNIIYKWLGNTGYLFRGVKC